MRTHSTRTHLGVKNNKLGAKSGPYQAFDHRFMLSAMWSSDLMKSKRELG